MNLQCKKGTQKSHRNYLAFHISSSTIVPLPITAKYIDFYSPIRVLECCGSWISSYHRARIQ